MNPQQLIGAIIAFLTALSALVGVPLTPGSSSPVHVVSRAEGSVSVSQQELIDATNRFRERNGLHALEPMPELNNLAQDWSERLAREGRLYHRPSFTSYYPAGWRYASENVLQNWSDANADVLVNQWATPRATARTCLIRRSPTSAWALLTRRMASATPPRTSPGTSPPRIFQRCP
ncbi:CAP domain-containing protein [Corynebacterium aquatimens]|uniref:CAP domain-containing protein n=1 Tax=Corynebacterium aquatimens TaxID=1190508 RepID=UPI00254105F9|nr:CAP domain-containing protein [Corynebacterium aquatimens]QYH20179.1 CAP domain-containing protein [Corynebacterium aquatimens]